MTKPTFTANEARRVFQATAEATGSDILQCCVECGEEPIIYRIDLLDYIDTYGGGYKGEDKDAAKRILAWIAACPTILEVEETLSDMGVPATWA